MVQMGIYLYSVVFSNKEFNIDKHGIDNENLLYAIDSEDLRAVVSPVSMEEYNEESLAIKINDIEWLKEKAILHSDLVNLIFHSVDSIIPIKFGTIFHNKENIINFLEENRHSLVENLIRLNGTVEWSIKVYCDLERFINTSMLEEKKELLSRISNTSKGAAYFIQKKISGQMETMAKSKVLSVTDQLFNLLMSESTGGKLNKLLSREATGQKFDMYMNAVFLIKKADIGLFLSTVDKYRKENIDNGILIEQSGPWAPYNFCFLD